MNKIRIALITLLLGCLIYVLWRSDSLKMFIWFNNLGLGSFLTCIRNITDEISMYFPYWFLYSLPAALWLFSGILLIDTIWGTGNSASKQWWLIVFIVLAFSTEIGQGLRIIPGTFDWQDMTFMTFSSSIAFWVYVYPNHNDRRLKS